MGDILFFCIPLDWRTVKQPRNIPVFRPELPDIDTYILSLQKIWKSQMVSNFGQFASQLENIVKQYLGSSSVCVVGNADQGLMLALQSLQLPPGSEIILPSFTFNSTANAVLWNNYRPVFADIQPDTFCLDPKDVQRKLSSKTRAILGVHVFGNPCDIAALDSLAQKEKLFLLFDSAHAYGSLYQNKKIGTLSDFDIFSFSGTKLVTSAEGGIITSRDPNLIEIISYLRNYGFLEDYNSQYLGINGKISELNAALGCLTFPTIERVIAQRNRLAKKYEQQLANIPGISFQLVKPGNRSAYKDFAILVDQRDELAAYLAIHGIQTKKYFRPIHQMSFFSSFQTNLPVTQRVAKRILCLPLYNQMTPQQQKRVTTTIKNFYQNQ